MAETSIRRQTLVLSTIEGLLYAVMVGTAESFAIIFAAKQDYSAPTFGWIATLPVFLGALTAWFVPMMTSHRWLKYSLISMVFLQVLGTGCLMFAASLESPTANLLLLGLSLYWMGGMASAPLWLDWVSAWLPSRKMGPFLSRRNAAVTLLTFLVYIGVSECILGDDPKPFDYFITFALAFSVRLIGLVLFLFHKRAPEAHRLEHPVPLSSPSLRSTPWLIVLLTICVLFRLAIGIASPYFTPYMFDELKMNVGTYVWLTAIPFLSRAFVLSQWGQSSQSFRPMVALKFATVGISFLPLAWILSTDNRWLAFVEVVTGVVFAAYDLSIMLILQKLAHGNSRRILGLTTALLSLAGLISAHIGGWLLEHHVSYVDLFRLSFGARFTIALLLILVARRIPELQVSLSDLRHFLWSTLSLRPSLANIGRLIPARKRINGSN